MSVTTEDALFEGSTYSIPFPKTDGHEVNELVLRLGGQLKLNRYDPDHVNLIQSLSLGKYVTLTVTASVDSKAQSITVNQDDDEVVTHAVRLKLHTIEAT